MNKKVTITTVVIILLLMILVGTFAWTDYTQHKSNVANGDGIRYNASLIEDYQEIESWKINDPAKKKEIRVTNAGLLDGSYGDVFVRLQIREYMETAPLEFIYSKYRLMIDTKGDYIRFDTATAASAAYGDHTIEPLQGLEDDKTYYYVQTQTGDINGQYGQYLLMSASPGDAVSIIGGVERATDTETGHHSASDGECAYTVHPWKATLADCGLEFHTYIKWLLGEDVITIDEWKDQAGIYKGAPVEKWICDTGSNSGWVYWGMPLAPGETTSNLLEKVQLISQPLNSFYYATHVDMQAVSKDEIIRPVGTKWPDAPTEIRDALTLAVVTDVEITSTITEVTAGTSQSFAALVSGYNISQDVEWSVSGNTDTTTIMNPSTGLLTIGADETGALTVKVLSLADGTTVDTITVDVISWNIAADGTAAMLRNASATGTIVIVGLDGKVGTTDDNKIVNPVGKVLSSGVSVLFDSGTPYVDLGNGFHLYPGADEVIGTKDDVINDFGNYYQSKNTMPTADATTNALLKDPIDWRLLDIVETATSTNAIIVSDQVLDNVRYHTSSGDITWENSNLRSWLNSRGGTAGKGSSGSRTVAEGGTIGFLDDAFDAAEQAKIVETAVRMDDPMPARIYVDAAYDGTAGYRTITFPAQNNTTDKVWALSAQEVWEYFGSNTISTPTDWTNGWTSGNAFAWARGTYQDPGTSGAWRLNNSIYWLRSPGQDASRASLVYTGGYVFANSGVTTATVGARPAITVRIQP